MTEGPAFRVHPQLGVLVKLPGWEHWRWILSGGQVQPGHASDAFASRSGWADPLEELRAQLAEEIGRRTLGGTPPPSDQRWANAKLPPPPSASDPNAPPHRREGMDRSGEGWKQTARPPLPAAAGPAEADDRCRNCGRTQRHCDRRTIKYCCSQCDHPGA
jgi:hypothetical protein